MAVKEALPEDEFLEFSSFLRNTIGEYIPGSKEFKGTAIQKGFTSVIYNANYTEETEKVEVKIVISKIGNEYKISG